MAKRNFKYSNKFSMGTKAAFWFTICNFFQRGISAFTTLVFTRLMSVSSFGTITLYNSWKQILMIFITLNLFYGMYNTGVVKFRNEENAFTSSMLGLTTVICFLYFGFCYFYRFPISGLLGLSSHQVLFMILDIFSSAIFSFWAAEERFNYRYKKLFFLTLLLFINSIGFPLLLMPYFNDKSNALIFGRVLGQFLITIYIYSTILIKGKKFISLKYWKFVFIPAITLIPHYISYEVLSVSDRIMISKMVGADKAAIYSASYTISLILTILISAINQAFAPWVLEKLSKQSYKGIDEVTKKVTWVFTFMIIIIVALAPEIIAIIVPNEYVEAIWIIAPVCSSTLFIFWYNIIANIEFFYLKTKSIAIASFIGAGLNIILNYFLIPQFGYIIAGYTTLFCYGIYFIMHYHTVTCICRDNLKIVNIFSVKTFILPLSICLICNFIALQLYYYFLLRYLIIIIACIAVVIFIYKRRNFI